MFKPKTAQKNREENEHATSICAFSRHVAFREAESVRVATTAIDNTLITAGKQGAHLTHHQQQVGSRAAVPR